jgi:hypothetical protein
MYGLDSGKTTTQESHREPSPTTSLIPSLIPVFSLLPLKRGEPKEKKRSDESGIETAGQKLGGIAGIIIPQAHQSVTFYSSSSNS